MKGIVFTGFLELVEQEFGLEVLDHIIENSELPSKGVYTSVGTYDFSEMLSLLTNLSNITKVEASALLHAFGRFFFSEIENNYSDVLENYSSPLEMISSIESHIHVHVRKIYPDAELPTFEVIDKSNNRLVLTYKSHRALYMFALGLMEKTFEHFDKNAQIDFDLIKNDGSEVKFDIKTSA